MRVAHHVEGKEVSEVTKADKAAESLMFGNAEVNRNWFPPKRLDETTRKCPTCGVEFEPRSRNHKYCSKKCKPDYKGTK